MSLLWTDPPAWVWTTAAIAAMLQLAALAILLTLTPRSKQPLPILWKLALIAFAIKLTLQALSVIPTLGHFAFSFRPVIIAYLHLVLLVFITFFLLGFFYGKNLLKNPANPGLKIFITGVLANETILLLQSGLAAMGIPWMQAPYYLLGAALCIFAGLLLLLRSNKTRPS
jgi:hypothetical protein